MTASSQATTAGSTLSTVRRAPRRCASRPAHSSAATEASESLNPTRMEGSFSTSVLYRLTICLGAGFVRRRRPAIGLEDEPWAPVPPDVVPRPLRQHDEAVAEPDQVHEVQREPSEPRQGPAQPDAEREVSDGRAPTDRRHRAPIEVAERSRRASV